FLNTQWHKSNINRLSDTQVGVLNIGLNDDVGRNPRLIPHIKRQISQIITTINESGVGNHGAIIDIQDRNPNIHDWLLNGNGQRDAVYIAFIILQAQGEIVDWLSGFLCEDAQLSLKRAIRPNCYHLIDTTGAD